jgi:L-alanine-DL-glutamate epimerase-like enolase superfamily enzyme
LASLEFPALELVRVSVEVFRYPVETPVATSFGVMRDRPAVFVRLEESGGAFGWGEIFANWPSVGAEHRARLLIEDISDHLLGQQFQLPSAAFHMLEEATHICALQSGEWGPFRQVIAGVDIAMHDLFARKLGLPARKMLNPQAADKVAAYASGIHVRDAMKTLVRCRELGFKRFKVKVGFDIDRDLAVVRDCLDLLKGDEVLMLDANQGWTKDQAIQFLHPLDGSGIAWIEEPIPADATWEDWYAVRAESPIPLAGGENIAGLNDFNQSIARSQFSFYQPDIAKWGGFTGCLQVAKNALGAGRTYCPHFLGGIVGLQASAELLAAVGGPGWLEVDVNRNPLRGDDGFLASRLDGGSWVLSANSGLGLENPATEIRPFQVLELCKAE